MKTPFLTILIATATISAWGANKTLVKDVQQEEFEISSTDTSLLVLDATMINSIDRDVYLKVPSLGTQ